MKKMWGSQSAQKKFSFLALLFLLISIPLSIYALTNISSFDTRNQAADLTVDVDTCQIRFPYINPSTIEVSKTVQVQVGAVAKGEAIKQVMIMDRTGASIFKKDYTDGRDTIAEPFTFKPLQVGDFGMLGTLTTDKGTRPCVVAQKEDVVVVQTNAIPEIKTTPTNGLLKVNGNYQYLLEVEDADNDTINFAFSFTPEATWLKSTIVENGSNGQLSIKFSGTPDKPGSYMANIFVHDGYTAHLQAQTWVISVDQDKNDVPKVTITAPAVAKSITKGEKVKVSWEATDLNQITRYELYVSSNPGNSSSWISVAKNLGPKIGAYIFDSTDMTTGTYQFIVKAFDNYTPPAYGVGYSAKVSIGKAASETDDGPILSSPQITNISPNDQATIQNKIASISATLSPASGAKVTKSSVKIMLDDTDITAAATITEVLDDQYSIIYNPTADYKEGIHKVTISFEDSKGNKAEKSWTFTIASEETPSDTINIFGLQIPKRLAMIIAGGIAIVILAILVPWLLYLAWKGTRKEQYEEVYEKTTAPSSPSYPVFVQEPEITEKKVEPTPVKEREEFFKSPKPLKENLIVETKPEPKPVPQIIPITPEEIKTEEPSPIQLEEVKEPEIVPQSVQNVPIATNTTPQNIPIVEEEDDDEMDEQTAKELEDLANKLKKQEDMLADLTGAPSKVEDTNPPVA